MYVNVLLVVYMIPCLECILVFGFVIKGLCKGLLWKEVGKN